MTETFLVGQEMYIAVITLNVLAISKVHLNISWMIIQVNWVYTDIQLKVTYTKVIAIYIYYYNEIIIFYIIILWDHILVDTRRTFWNETDIVGK